MSKPTRDALFQVRLTAEEKEMLEYLAYLEPIGGASEMVRRLIRERYLAVSGRPRPKKPKPPKPE